MIVAIVAGAFCWSPVSRADDNQKAFKELYTATGVLVKQVYDNVDFFIKKAGPKFSERDPNVFPGSDSGAAKEIMLKNYQLCTDQTIDGMADPETGEKPIVESMIRKMWKRVLGYKKQFDGIVKDLEAQKVISPVMASVAGESKEVLAKRRDILMSAIKVIREDILVNLKDAAKVISSNPDQLKILETLLRGRPYEYSAIITLRPRHGSECVERKMFERYQDIKEKALKSIPENLESILKILDAELETLNRKLS